MKPVGPKHPLTSFAYCEDCDGITTAGGNQFFTHITCQKCCRTIECENWTIFKSAAGKPGRILFLYMSTRWTINAAALRDRHLGETLSDFRKLWYTWNEPPFEDDDLED